jgi:hypothetical protein
MPFRAPTSFHDTSGTKKIQENCITEVHEYKVREDTYFIKNQCSNNSAKRGGGKNCLCPTTFCSHKYHKIVNNLFFEQVKKIFLAKTLRILGLFTQKFVIKLSKIWVWDPGSVNLSRIPDPG